MTSGIVTTRHVAVAARPSMLVAAYGIEAGEALAELANRVGISPNGPDPTRRIVESYVYVDEHNQPLYAVDRWEPKDFRNAAATATEGGSGPHEGRAASPLSAARRTHGRRRRRRHDLRGQGERDVHAVEAVGEVGTTNAGGAGKWREEYSRCLVGAQLVVVVADADAAGRKHAAEVAATLHAAGSR